MDFCALRTNLDLWYQRIGYNNSVSVPNATAWGSLCKMLRKTA